MVSELRCEVIARVVDIGRHVIVDRHCLYFLWEGGVSELRCEVIVRFVDICTHAIVAINVYSVSSSSVEDRGFETRSIRSIYRLYNLYLLILR